jgi:membrane protein
MGLSCRLRYLFIQNRPAQVAQHIKAGQYMTMSQTFAALGSFAQAIWARISAGHFGLIAAGVAFYAMFAVFPGLAASVAIWSLVADPAIIADYLQVAERFMPTDVAILIHDQVMGLLATPRATLGWATFVSVSIALYSARAGVAAIIAGLMVVHRAEPRGFFWGVAVDIIMTMALISALFAAFVTVIIVPIMLRYVELGPLNAWFLSVLPWAAMMVLVMTCLAILYRYGPNMPDGAGRPHVMVGVLVASLSWSMVSLAFSAYLSNFDSYNRIYGSIGAVVALLMWLYLSVWAVLFGGAINAELFTRSTRSNAVTGLELSDPSSDAPGV